MLEQQLTSLESGAFDQNIFEGMKMGQQAMNQVQAKMDIDAMEDLKDDMQEQMDKQEEINDFFVGVANEGNDEIEDELADLMAETEAEEFANIDIGSGAIENQNPAAAQKAPTKKEEVTAAEEEELEAMMAL